MEEVLSNYYITFYLFLCRFTTTSAYCEFTELFQNNLDTESAIFRTKFLWTHLIQRKLRINFQNVPLSASECGRN